MTEDQIKMANILLKVLVENDGLLSIDEISDLVAKPNNFDLSKLLEVRKILQKEDLVVISGANQYLTMITTKGWDAAQMGIIKYISF